MSLLNLESFYEKFIDFYTCGVSDALKSIKVDDLLYLSQKIVDTRDKRGTVYCFGNGGSAGIASHFVHNLNWDVSANMPDNKKIKAIALNDQCCHMTGIANDRHYDQVFAAQLKNLLEKNDLVIGISASGNSENVLEAIKYTKERGVNFVTLTGCDGGLLKKLGNFNINVDYEDQQISEDVQHAICHMVVRMLHYYNLGESRNVGVFSDIAQLRLKEDYLKARENNKVIV